MSRHGTFLCSFAGLLACACAGAREAASADPLATQTECELSVELPSGRIGIERLPPGLPADRKHLAGWMRRSGEAVAGYFGRMPVPEVRLEIELFDGSGVGSGSTRPWEFGALVVIPLGSEPVGLDLDRDWVLVHELVHGALPNLPEAQHWMEEGLATYVEPVARARAGLITPREVWREWIANYPQGYGRGAEGGLNGTRDWGRTYYGGALYWLLADVELRRRSGNEIGLEHALRGILARGGSLQVDWPVGIVLEAAEAATGKDVLRELYEELGTRSWARDWAKLWHELGLSFESGDFVVDEHAPLAAVRRAITAR